MAQLLFETFSVPSFLVVPTPVLSIHSTAALTGLVVESGADFTFVSPVYEGYMLTFASTRIMMGGETLTAALARQIFGVDWVQLSHSDREAVRSAKEDKCAVAVDYAQAQEDFALRKHLAWTFARADAPPIEMPGQELFEV